MRNAEFTTSCCKHGRVGDRCLAMLARLLTESCSERNPMKRIALPLGLAALLISSPASAIKVPTGTDDINLNVNVLLQARYEGTFEGSVEKSLDSDFFLRRARLQASGTA